MKQVVIIRYAEIYLKGKNRGFFEQIFANNIENNLGLLSCGLNVHCAGDECEKAGNYTEYMKENVKLGNKQALMPEMEQLSLFNGEEYTKCLTGQI